MTKTSAYINDAIKRIQSEYNPESSISRLNDTEIQREWSSFQHDANNFWRRINTLEDVRRLIDVFKNTVESVDKTPFGCLHVQDEYDMAIALYKVIHGLRKITVAMDTITCLQPEEFRIITESDVDNMTEIIMTTIGKMKSIIVRKAMQE